MVSFIIYILINIIFFLKKKETYYVVDTFILILKKKKKTFYYILKFTTKLSGDAHTSYEFSVSFLFKILVIVVNTNIHLIFVSSCSSPTHEIFCIPLLLILACV